MNAAAKKNLSQKLMEEKEYILARIRGLEDKVCFFLVSYYM